MWCGLTEPQKAEYQTERAVILKQAGQNYDSSSVIGGKRVREVRGDESKATVQWGHILPSLTKLRHICNISETLTSTPPSISPSRHLSSGSSSDDETHLNAISTDAESSVVDPVFDLSSLLKQSRKLQVLDELLKAIRSRRGQSDDKVVIVSNFTSVLDLVQCLCRERRWSTLRIDGSVSSDKRMKIVKHFNDANSMAFVMLLSAKAGGVGLNLIGANRLVCLLLSTLFSYYLHRTNTNYYTAP